jgi:hypothetical protein
MARTSKATLLCLAAMVITTGCLFQKKAKPVAYTPPPPRPSVKPGPPPVLPAEPDLEADVSLPPSLPVYIPTIPEPPRPPRPKQQPPVATGPKPPANPSTDPVVPAPRLGQIFTPEEVREYNQNLDQSLDNVRKALGTLGKKRLSKQDGQTVERIQTFQRQAEQARQEDLVTAVSLARRADLLAQDLLKRLP